MLDKEQSAARFHDTPQFAKRSLHIRNRAQRPRRDDGIHGVAFKRDRFR
jgi:hypothetical protein